MVLVDNSGNGLADINAKYKFSTLTQDYWIHIALEVVCQTTSTAVTAVTGQVAGEDIDYKNMYVPKNTGNVDLIDYSVLLNYFSTDEALCPMDSLELLDREDDPASIDASDPIYTTLGLAGWSSDTGITLDTTLDATDGTVTEKWYNITVRGYADGGASFDMDLNIAVQICGSETVTLSTAGEALDLTYALEIKSDNADPMETIDASGIFESDDVDCPI